MTETLLPHPVQALALLGELEVEEAVLFARKAQALVDYRTECEVVAPQGARFLALDLAVECGIAQVTATARLAAAEQLVHELPGTHALLREGRLRVGQGLVLLEETRGLDTALCARLEQVVLPQLGGLTAGETRRLVKRELVRLDAGASEERRAQRHRERRAFVSPKPDGRAFLGVHGSAEAATGFWEELTLLAGLRSARTTRGRSTSSGRTWCCRWRGSPSAAGGGTGRRCGRSSDFRTPSTATRGARWRGATT